MLPELIIGYVIGFIDAEASFSISIKIQEDLVYKVRLDPVFSITQAKKEPLEIVRQAIGAGRIIKKPGQRHLYLLIIDNMDELVKNLIPFIDRYEEFLYVKKDVYRIFKDIVMALHKGVHKDMNQLKELITKAYKLSSLSSKSRRKRNIEEIFKIIDSYGQVVELPGER